MSFEGHKRGEDNSPLFIYNHLYKILNLNKCSIYTLKALILFEELLTPPTTEDLRAKVNEVNDTDYSVIAVRKALQTLVDLQLIYRESRNIYKLNDNIFSSFYKLSGLLVTKNKITLVFNEVPQFKLSYSIHV